MGGWGGGHTRSEARCAWQPSMHGTGAVLLGLWQAPYNAPPACLLACASPVQELQPGLRDPGMEWMAAGSLINLSMGGQGPPAHAASAAATAAAAAAAALIYAAE